MVGKDSPFLAPLDSLGILSLPPLFLEKKGECFIPIALEIHTFWLLPPWQNLGVCRAGLRELLAAWIRGSAKTLRSDQLDSSPRSAAPQLGDFE